MAVVNKEIHDSLDQDITSELSLYILEAPRDSLYWVMVQLNSLDPNAANITINVYWHTEKNDFLLYTTGAVAKTLADDAQKHWHSPQPFFMLENEYIEVKVLSSNANDTTVGSTVCIVDPYADGYDANDVRQISVKNWGDTDVSAKVADGYVQVDAVKIGGGAPQSMYALDTTVAIADTTTSFTLSAGKTTNGAYVGQFISVEDADDSNVETRRITGWTSGKVVTVDKPFSFIPANGDVVHVMEEGYGDVNVNEIEGSDATDQIAAAIKAMTGFTAGGTWTYQEVIKLITAYILGTWRDKSGDPTTQEILDAEDDATVILEILASKTSPYKATTKQ